LDEALHELEAVDAELQTDGKSPRGESNNNTAEVVEGLQHLFRWILQESPIGGDGSSHPNLHNLSKDPKALLRQIQQALEDWIAQTSSAMDDTKSVHNLQSQVSVYKEELKSREESSAELRDSLKEAVALLKPLQDAVAKAEDEKVKLLQQLDVVEKQREDDRKRAQGELSQTHRQVEDLQNQVESLQEQVEEHKQLSMARQSMLEAAQSSPPKTSGAPLASGANANAEQDSKISKIQRAREELRRKRETEGNLQQLLKDAQSRFHSLHQQNDEAAAANRELQGKLKVAEDQLGGGGVSVEDQLVQLQQTLTQKEEQLALLRRELLEKAQADNNQSQSNNNTQQQQQQQQQHFHQVTRQLQKATHDLAQKEQTERILNKSLKDALGLLKPLQMHLEDAEQEKMDISKELRNLRKRFRQLQMGDTNTFDNDAQSRSTTNGDVSLELVKIKEELEETVRQLEMENSQLHDALEDLSGEEGNSPTNQNNTQQDAKWRQQVVELHSRYEVTQNRLEDAQVENHALVKAVKQKEVEERQRQQEYAQMKERLAKTENELHNAKAIARSALVKVEELTMANVEQLSLSRDGSLELNNHNQHHHRHNFNNIEAPSS
jgi:chromosome segregation ATPase